MELSASCHLPRIGLQKQEQQKGTEAVLGVSMQGLQRLHSMCIPKVAADIEKKRRGSPEKKTKIVLILLFSTRA